MREINDALSPARKTIGMKRADLGVALTVVERAGFVLRGAFTLEDDERVGALANVRTIVLAGMAGREGWDAFAASPEASDGGKNPLDRWSRRVIEVLAGELGAIALFPFGGPPFWPFQQWSRRAEPVHPSPIGILIHPLYGLWHSYRGALGFLEAFDIPELTVVPSPCESCPGRWCMKACPVGGFSADGYDIAACVGCLKSAAGADCMGLGCRARRACPVGAEHAYGAEQANFFMQAFLRGQGG